MIKSATESYLNAAVDHGGATQSGDAKACNLAYDRIIAALTILRKLPDRGEAALSELVNHPDESVRTWAATHLLPLDEISACKALEDVAKGAGLVAFDAMMVLKEWRTGRLKLP